MIDATQTRSLFGPPRSLFGILKKGVAILAFWAVFLAPQGGRRQVAFAYKKGRPFLPMSLFRAQCGSNMGWFTEVDGRVGEVAAAAVSPQHFVCVTCCV